MLCVMVGGEVTRYRINNSIAQILRLTGVFLFVPCSLIVKEEVKVKVKKEEQLV